MEDLGGLHPDNTVEVQTKKVEDIYFAQKNHNILLACF